MSVNLKNDYFDPSIRHRDNLISLNDSDKLDITRVYYCDGLVLCVTEDYTRLVVWNPYTSQTRWISVKPIANHHRGIWYNHALGRDKETHKVLRFFLSSSLEKTLHEIYDVKSSSWRVLDVSSDWIIEYSNSGMSLKGNTYWFAQDEVRGGGVPGFLICFDFTRERFELRLPLPFESYCGDVVSLSIVREEQLAVMFQNCETYEMEVWVTTKIEPNTVSWSKFLAVDTKPITGFLRLFLGRSFIVDEEKRAVVVFDEGEIVSRNLAYFIGENGYLREVDIGEITTKKEVSPHALSYVPSSVQINQPA